MTCNGGPPAISRRWLPRRPDRTGPPAPATRNDEVWSGPTGPTSGRRTTRQSRPESSDSDKHRVPLRLPPSRHGYGCWSQSTSMAPSRPSSSTLCKPGRCPQGLEALRAAAALGGVIAAIVSRRDLATLAAKSASNPTTSAQPLCVRSAAQPGSVNPHRQRWSTQTAHHSAAESQNQAAPSLRAHERMMPQPAGPPPLATGTANRHSLPLVGCSRCLPGRPA